jgi:transcriptional regulator with XRE-family HTH domain
VPAPDITSPLVRRRAGLALRRLREKAGKTQTDVTEAKIMGRTKLIGLESGSQQFRLREGDVLTLCRFYRATPQETDALVALVEAGHASSYWEEYGPSIPDWLGLYADLEPAAETLVAWEPEVISGLLQTPDYAEALMRVDERLDPAEIRKLVSFRLARQRAVFQRDPRSSVTIIQGPGSLGVQVGGPDVMAEQIQHLRDVQDADLADVLVLPPGTAPYPILGAFTVLDFADPADPAVVFAEVPMGARYLERPSEVAELRWAIQKIRTVAVPIKEYR